MKFTCSNHGDDAEGLYQISSHQSNDNIVHSYGNGDIWTSYSVRLESPARHMKY